MKIILLFLAVALVGTISAAFLLALSKTFCPEEVGFIQRIIFFSWKYCWPAGVTAAVIFIFLYRNALK